MGDELTDKEKKKLLKSYRHEDYIIVDDELQVVVECRMCEIRKKLGTGNCSDGKLPYFKCRLGQQTLI